MGILDFFSEQWIWVYLLLIYCNYLQNQGSPLGPLGYCFQTPLNYFGFLILRYRAYLVMIIPETVRAQ